MLTVCFQLTRWLGAVRPSGQMDQFRWRALSWVAHRPLFLFCYAVVGSAASTPDTADPVFVPRGFGVLKGLKHLEHCEWARHLPHPADDLRRRASAELTQALPCGGHTSADAIVDGWLSVVRRWMDMVSCSKHLLPKWLTGLPEVTQSVPSRLVGRLIVLLIRPQLS